MTEITMATPTAAPADNLAINLDRIGQRFALYGLVLVFGWIGAMKFTAYEAMAIEGLIASSPLMAWLYDLLSVRATAIMIGVVELTAALLLAARPWLPRAGLVGAGLVLATTATTLTFLFTAPGWEASLGGFPALSVLPGQFLIKDAVLFGTALWIFGDALREITAR